MFGAIMSVAGPLISGVMGSNSAKDASRAQQEGDKAAIAEQRRQYDVTRADTAPFREAGSAATMRLRELMGLGSAGPGTPMGGGASVSGARAMSDISVPDTPDWTEQDQRQYEALLAQYQSGQRDRPPDREPPSKSELEVRRLLQEFRAEQAARANAPAPSAPTPPASSDPYQMYGDSPLMRRFTVGDFWADPVTKLGLQFGLDEGTKAIDRMAGSRGMRNSGQTLKALTRFGTDYTGTKAGESQNRFENERTGVYNRLAGIAGSGQTAANTTTAAGTSMANNVASLLSSGGNARGAAAIAGGNALGGAGTSIANYWNQQNMLDRLDRMRGGSSTSPYYGTAMDVPPGGPW